MAKNVYIHIPFCKQKCKYCSFISYPDISKKEQYLSALNREISNKYKSEILSTLYFGGGTPSLLTVEEFAGIIKKFAINSKTEITVEVNPETVTYDYLLNLKKSGVNRLSIGCQTFNDEILEYIGRKHSSNDVKKVVSYVKEIGYKNISIDLIYGLPYQILGDFEKDLYTAVNLGIQHVSLYGLKIDEGCYFYNHCPKNLPDEDMQAQMYLKAIEILVQNGFNQYEVSNFAKEKFVSNHNLNYWDNNSYYGFGVAAHGYINGVRYSNPIALSDYIKNPLKPCNIKELSEQ